MKGICGRIVGGAGFLLGIAAVVGCGSTPALDEEANLDGATAALEGPDPGRRLFDHETFGGNGRTCRTCHSSSNGTLTLDQIAERFAEDPSGPLFRGDGTDDGQGNGTSRIRADGTILMRLTLPANVQLLDDQAATIVTLQRGIPTTLNTPALDPVLMYDGRAPNLVEQARGAIHDHAANTVEPTTEQLELIESFEKTLHARASCNRRAG